MVKEDKIFTKTFKAFSDKSRLRIVKILADKEKTVNEIVVEMGLSQPTVSRHLAILRDAEIVIDRRDGQQVFYSLNKNTIQESCCGFCITLKIPVKSPKKRKKS
jgi:DNA-binding transcriptional ArsR family regulator